MAGNKNLRVVTWNCQGAFRKKYKNILKYSPDICVIQECEDPSYLIDEEFQRIFPKKFWVGTNQNKGLGIFVANECISVSLNNWDNHGIEHFLPVSLGQINLVAVWACNNYIEDAYTYFSVHKHKLDSCHIICGDFNSSSIWDLQKRRHIRNHGSLVRLFSDAGLQSAYHYWTGRTQGKETDPTFYLHRNKSRPFHIDYVFCDNARIGQFRLETYDDWISLSDHMPIMFDYEMP